MEPEFATERSRHGDDLVVSVHGEIDLVTSQRLWAELEDAIPEARDQLVLDLRDTSFIDSTGLGVFVRASRELREQGSNLVLRSPRGSVRKVLETTGFIQFMTIEP